MRPTSTASPGRGDRPDGGDAAVDRVEASLAAIDRLDPTVGAFAHVEPGGARAAARAVEEAASGSGPLAGWPVGVKDVCDTADQPTELGSPIHAGRRPGRDAGCVARLRTAGAVVVGKTVTCEFAYLSPGATRNPHRLDHTPGGSSSGSAAAVAAGMVRAAVGTQTAGSVLRPAAYCGVVGYKPTFGWVPRAGVMPLAESLDTVGVFAATVADAGRAGAVLAARPGLRPAEWPDRRWPRLRVGVCRTPEWGAAEPPARDALDRVAGWMADAGCRTEELELGAAFDEALRAHHTIMAAEAAGALADERRRHRDQLSPELCVLLEEGEATHPIAVDHARDVAASARREAAAAFERVDVVVTLAAPGEAPRGLASTGDPRYNRRWTLLGTPAVALPVTTGPAGLPVAVQLTGPPGGDAALLATADRLASLAPGCAVPEGIVGAA